MTLLLFIEILAALGVGFFVGRSSKDKEIEALKIDQLTKNADLNKEKGFQDLVEAVNKTIKNFDEKVSKFESDRNKQYGSLGENIKSVLDTGTKINDTALTLKSALSSSGAVKGRWGENTLISLLRESGLIEGPDFKIQETIPTENGLLRPDIIINFPESSRLAIDSKASLDNYIKFDEEKDPEKSSAYLDQFIKDLRGRIKDLSSKEYQKHIEKSIPYVIMYVPSEPAIRAAFAHDNSLYQDAQKQKVMISSPTTIIPILMLVSHAWTQYKTTKNAEQLNLEVKELGDRLKTFFSHVSDMGINISRALKEFNKVVGSYEGRIVPQIDKVNILRPSSISLENNLEIAEEEVRTPKRLLETKKK